MKEIHVKEGIRLEERKKIGYVSDNNYYESVDSRKKREEPILEYIPELFVPLKCHYM